MNTHRTWLGLGLYATFSIILIMSWPSVLLVEETGVPREKHRHATSR